MSRLTLVVAIDAQRGIGIDNKLPWHLPEDLAHFKRVTIGKPIIMGRKTWESIGRPLPGRASIVVTRDANFRAEGADVVTSLEDGITLAAVRGRCMPGADEACVIGGGEIYRQALAVADRLYVTHVLADIDGDTRFPSIDPAIWEAVSTETYPASDKDTHATRYTVYERREAMH